MSTRLPPLRQPRVTFVAVFAALLFLAGCQTPDLKPFAAASATLATSINQGGDLALGNNAALQAEWDLRRKTADALLVYSASLSAIADASAKRKENATALIGSVRKLAEAVPGANLGTSAADNLLITLVGTVVEVKAFHDLAAAVKSADPAITAIAAALHQDFDTLAKNFGVQQDTQSNQILAALRAPERYLTALKAKQEELRKSVAGDLSNKDHAAELMRIDGLLAGVEPEVTQQRAALARIEADRAQGQAFFAAATHAIDAWAAAHTEIAKALQEKRQPSLALLAVRAQELHGLIADFKASKTK